MLNQLKDLVFGYREYEKTRLEERFILIKGIFPKLKLENVSDFEILEEIIYKIKEQLRIKSSNINKAILDPKRDFTKKQVNELIDELNKLKYDFLNKAFNFIEKQAVNSQIRETQKSEEIESPVKETSRNDAQELYYENESYKVILENKKVPYILVSFKETVDLRILKYLSALFFEVYKCEGTNIIIESNSAMIVPRTQDDNLIELPKIESNLEEIFNKIISKANGENIQEGEFKEIKEVSEEPIRTRKKDEDSLDSLISGIEKGEIKAKPQVDNSTKVEVEKDEEVKVEEKEKEIKEEGVEVEKTQTPLVEAKNFEVYRDDKIVAYVNINGRVAGEVVVEPLNGLTMKELEESDTSYLYIFSKIFATIVFEATGAQGTNIVMDYNNNRLRIIPRNQDDKVGLTWDPKQDKPEFLEQIKDKLIEEMSKEINKTNESSSETTKEVKKDSTKEEKLKNILEVVKRIP